MAQSSDTTINVVIVTALKDEYDQVLAVESGAIDPKWYEGQGRDGRLVATRKFHAASGQVLQAIVTWATEMGGIAAAAIATSMIEKYNPCCLAMCGICAGRREKVSLGDVIFADRLWAYDQGKLVVEVGKDGKRLELFSGDIFQYRLPDSWKQRVEAYKIEAPEWLELRPLSLLHQADWLMLQLSVGNNPREHPEREKRCPDWIITIDYLRKKGFIKRTGLQLTFRGRTRAEELELLHIDGLPPPDSFRIHLAPIATGSRVVEDPDIFNRLSISMRKVLGIEMEASAIGAVGDLKDIPVIVAKAVSDFADEKDDRVRRFAARASAECLIGFMQKYLPELISKDDYSVSLRSELSNSSPEKTNNDSLLTQRCNILPRDIATFTGRFSQVEVLIEALKPRVDGSTPLAVAINAIDGMPGIGKTALAVHVAHRIASMYPDAQLFLDLHGYTPGREPVAPAGALDSLLRALGIPPSRIPETLDERSALWRSEIAQRRAIVVLDNANSHEQVRPLLPGHPSSCVLITSRKKLNSLEGVHDLSLDVLSPNEAVSLFQNLVGDRCSNSDIESVQKVVGLCGHLPLAIQLVGNRWRHRRSWHITDVLAKLENTRTRLQVFSAESIEVATAFELSYNELDSRQQKLFRRLGLHPGVDITPQAAAVLLQCSYDEAEQLLDTLFDHSLVSEPERARYKLHDLLRDYARDLARTVEPSAKQYEAQLRLLTYYLHAVDSADRVLDPHRHRSGTYLSNLSVPETSFEDYRHAFNWLQIERINILACAQLSLDRGLLENACSFGQALAHFLLRAGYYNESYHIHTQSYQAAKTLKDAVLEAQALTNLAQSCHAVGQFDQAKDLFQQALQLWSSTSDQDGCARTLSGLGFTLERTGMYHEALSNLDAALKIRRITGDSYGEAHVLNAVGAVYWRLHEYSQALASFNLALSIRRNIGDRNGEARTVNNIGFTYQRLERYDEAQAWLNEALAIARDLRDRDLEIVTLNNLGYTLGSCGKWDDGVQFAVMGLELAQSIGALYEEGRALDALARCAVGQSKIEAATIYWKDALLVFEKAGVPEAGKIRSILQMQPENWSTTDFL